jgi:hypothetical protein
MKSQRPTSALSLFLFHYFTGQQATTSAAESCTGVSGSFALKGISGPCSYMKLLEEYTRQIYNATGSVSTMCLTGRSGDENNDSLSAKDDFDFKLIAAMPDAGTPEVAAMSICRTMYDNPDIVT